MTSDIVSSALQWLNTHAEYSWLITFVISASESIAVIGTIVPGSITMTALGALAGSGIIPLWSTIIWAFLGAIVGDGISYSIGYYFKGRLHQVWPFRNNLALLGKGEKFFNRYGGTGVFIGRFVGPIRALIPLVAGMMGMKPLHFLFANIASAAGWAPAYMLPGILLGAASLELPPDIATRVILILIFWTLFLLLCLWLIRKIPLFTHHQIIRFFNKVWKGLRTSRHWGFARMLLRHNNPDKTPLQLTLVFYLFLTCVVFIGLATYVYVHGSSHIFINESIYHFFRGIYTTGGKNFMVYLTLLGQKQVLIPVICLIIAWLLFTKHWYIALHGLGLFALTALSVITIKHCVHSARPWGIIQAPESFSFPSGHTTLTTTFYLGLVLLMSHALSGKGRKLLYTLAGLIILAVSVSRLYLGAHWFTDVVGGWILSIALLTFISISFNRKKDFGIEPRKLILMTLLCLSIIYAFVAYRSAPQLEANYTQLDLPIQEAELNRWWSQQNNDFLPEWRVSLFGFPSQSINIEWIGKLSDIENTLAHSGWQPSAPRDWINILFRLSGIQSGEHLPLISPLYLDKKPALVLIKYIPAEKKLLVLRLWQSNTVLKGTQEPLWVGVVGLVPRTYGWLSRHYKMDIDVTPQLVFNTPPSTMKWKTITVTIPHKKKNPTQTIMLIR